MKPMQKGLQELGVLSGLLPNFPEPQAQFSLGMGALNTQCLVVALTVRSHFRAIPTNQSHYCLTLFHFTELSSPHETVLLPSHKKGKACLENLQRGTTAKNYLKLKSALCAMKPAPQLLSLAGNPLLPSTSLMLPMLLQLPSQTATQAWVFPQVCT